jgi:AcrR family transcriptional regulator
LTRDQILRATWHLLDRDGLAGFTMRRLAEELSVAPMTLYGYFEDKDALLDAVLDLGSERFDIRIPAGRWRQGLRELCLQLYDTLCEHPFIVDLRRRRPIVNPGALRFTEAAMRILGVGGFPPDLAPRALRPLFVYVFGYAAFSSAVHDEAGERAALATLLSVPADRYPAVAAAAPALAASLGGREQFEYGLERILDGLQAERRTRR